jgi:hypothetical protein
MSQDIIKEIKKSIKESGNKVFWYDTSSTPKLLVSGETKSETKKKVKKLKLKEGTQLYRLVIEFHSGKKLGQGGKICVEIKTYIISENKVKFENTWKKKANGNIWFDDEFLEERKWKISYLNNIVNKINNNTIKFGFGLFLYRKIK